MDRKSISRFNLRRLIVLGFFLMLVLAQGNISVARIDDIWSPKAAMPTAREDLAAVVMEEQIYVLGGYDGTNNLAMVEVYNPVTDYWDSSKTPMPTARGWLAATVVNGRIYAVGGQDDENNYLATVETYDPVTDTWESLTPMPTPRYGLAVVAVGDRIYALGGFNSEGNYLATVEEYNPATDTWRSRAPMSTPRYGLAAVMVRGRLYALGGHNAINEFLATVEEYDPIINQWSRVSDIPTPRFSLAAVTVGGRIYAIGGWEEARPRSVEEYNPTSDTWHSRATLPSARTGLAAAVVGGRIYAIGGYDGNTRLESVEEYDPPFYDTDSDGFADDEELRHGRDPLVPETDLDTDGDGLLDLAEIVTYGTNPWVPDVDIDTDGDGLTNVEEVDTYGTNPNVIDTDGDEFSDGQEVTLGTNPQDPEDYPSKTTSEKITTTEVLNPTTTVEPPRSGLDTFKDLLKSPVKYLSGKPPTTVAFGAISSLILLGAAIKAVSIPPLIPGKRTIKDFLKRFLWYVLYPFSWIFGHVIYDPVCRRLKKKNVTTNKTRQTILQLLEKRGVAHLREIERAIGPGFFGLMWHLQVLDDFGYVRHMRVGKYQVYYLKGYATLDTSALELAVLFKNENARNIIEYIMKHPGTYQAEIARVFALHHDSVRYHLLQIKEKELLESFSDGRITRYFILDEKRHILDSILDKTTLEPTYLKTDR